MTDATHILVVDDEPDMCWALENILKLEGYHVTSATSGKKALRLAKDGDFEMAFIDVRLLDIDGIKLCRLIREALPETRAIAISGYLYHDDVVIQQGLEEGIFAEFISKPFDMDEIYRVVKKALQNY